MAHTKLNYTQTAALFETVATKHKVIKHFVETDLQEIKDIVKTAAPAMLYTGYKEGISGYKSDNNQSGKRIHFAIVQRQSTKSRTVKSKHQLIDECRELAIDVLSWLRREKRQGRLNGYEPDSVDDGEAIILTDDGFIGWEFGLLIKTPINLAFVPEKWNE
ncbi:MAG: hypothetical protein HQ521_12845 [Bacteroidetes bacterium]|nr:hypothetical protein [Bacteroidota bacterium]